MIKADLHVHTVLSPCGDIEMTPAFIIRRAKESGLGIIGITDHNSTLQCLETKRIGEREGVFVICGAEITTKEEVHVLAFVEGEEKLEKLQNYLSGHLPKILNNAGFFGYQLVVNEKEEILSEEVYLLISAIDQTIEQTEKFVHSLGGIFIPAHIDKRQNSLLSQLGFLPPGLKIDALELKKQTDVNMFISQNDYLKKYNFIKSSDAHFPGDFGEIYTELDIESPSFFAIKEALISNGITV
ncbi:MAG: PHP domain-containing protein [Rikenellaceae bacterium]